MSSWVGNVSRYKGRSVAMLGRGQGVQFHRPVKLCPLRMDWFLTMLFYGSPEVTAEKTSVVSL